MILGVLQPVSWVQFIQPWRSELDCLSVSSLKEPLSVRQRCPKGIQKVAEPSVVNVVAGPVAVTAVRDVTNSWTDVWMWSVDVERSHSDP